MKNILNVGLSGHLDSSYYGYMNTKQNVDVGMMDWFK